MSSQNNVKTGKEILDAFFQSINSIDGIDIKISNALFELCEEGKLTESNVVNKLKELREANAD